MKTYLVIFVLALAGLVHTSASLSIGVAPRQLVPCDNVTEIPAPECEALVALFNSTQGSEWARNDGWVQTNTPCSWYGVECSEGSVTVLQLESNQLNGTIPSEVGNLSNLQNLNLRTNQLTGVIPVSLGDLSNMNRLALDNNGLTGGIPSELGNLSNLQFLDLGANQLTGNIAPSLGNLSNLQVLILGTNPLTGAIPLELGNLSSLQGLYLHQSQLTGTIPPELGNLSNLINLWLAYNQLTGEIPSELGTLDNLSTLWLQSNQLSGQIPVELANLSSLQDLQLANNQLTGAIPSSLGSLPTLRTLDLFSNQLTGPIPAALSNLANLERLYLSYNQLTGAIPPELANLSTLNLLWLDNNQLTGTIPVQFTALSLNSFLFGATGLCEPPDPAFQAWLDTIPDLWSTEVLCSSPITENGFDPAADGYSFANDWSSFNPFSHDFGRDELRMLFGDEHVCSVVILGACALRMDARAWMNQARQAMDEAGRCYGMGLTASEFFEGIDTPSRLDSDASQTYDLTRNAARVNIAMHMVMQWTGPVRETINEETGDTAAVVARIEDELAAGRAPLLALFPEQGGGHAVTPHRVEDQGNGDYLIRVYDNNHANQSRDISVSGDQWNYIPWDGDSWSGGNGTLSVLAASDHSVNLGCPWCEGVFPEGKRSIAAQSQQAQLWLEGPAHLLITNDSGQQIGYREGTLVNEIPGALAVPIIGGIRMDLEPVYTVPLTGTYETIVDGEALTATTSVTLTQFSPQYTASVANLELDPTTADSISFLTEPGITFSASASKEPDFTLIVDTLDEMHQLRVGGADVAAGDSIQFEVNVADGQATFQHRGVQSGGYVLSITRLNEAGPSEFRSTEVPVSAGSTHIVNFGTWDGEGSILLQIDENSDGTVDSGRLVNNENGALSHFLPIIQQP